MIHMTSSDHLTAAVEYLHSDTAKTGLGMRNGGKLPEKSLAIN
jgi:hypothetical protein